jgi:purine nucleoside phosphorylase
MATDKTGTNLTRRKALALGLSGTAFLAAGAPAAQAAAASSPAVTAAGADTAAAPAKSGVSTAPFTPPDGETVEVAVINRDRKWMDFESMATLEKTFTIDTPIGTSPTIRKLRYKGVPFYYIPRYGDVGSGEIAATDDESFPGERSIQIWVTLMTLGVRNVLHGNLIGCVNPEWSMTDAVVIDDFIDFKPNHPQSVLPFFFKGKPDTDWKHWGTRMNPVLCPDLRLLIYDQALTYHFSKVHYGGTMSQTHTDRWETPAEVRMLRQLKVDVSCTLDGTYIVYAKQAGIHFATVMILMNFAEGERPLDVPMMSEYDMNVRAAESMRKTLLEAIAGMKNFQHHCDCFKLEEKRYRDVFPYTKS